MESANLASRELGFKFPPPRPKVRARSVSAGTPARADATQSAAPPSTSIPSGMPTPRPTPRAAPLPELTAGGGGGAEDCVRVCERVAGREDSGERVGEPEPDAACDAVTEGTRGVAVWDNVCAGAGEALEVTWTRVKLRTRLYPR